MAGGELGTVAGFLYKPNDQTLAESQSSPANFDQIKKFRSHLFEFYEANNIAVFEPYNAAFSDLFQGATTAEEKKTKFRESVFKVLGEIYFAMRYNFRKNNNSGGTSSNNFPSELQEFFVSKPQPAEKVEVKINPDVDLINFKNQILEAITRQEGSQPKAAGKEAGTYQPGQQQPTQAASTQPDPSNPGPNRPGPSHGSQSQDGASQVRPTQADPNQAGPSQAGPYQVGHHQPGPNQAGPSSLNPAGFTPTEELQEQSTKNN